MALRSFGTTFQIVGTAAIQTCRVAAAAGAGKRHEGEHPGAGCDQLPHPTTIDPFMSGWIRQM